MTRLVLGLAVVFCLAIPPISNADDAEDHFKRGFAWANKGEYDKAIAEYNQTMQLLDPNNPNDAAHIASVCFNRGKALNHKGENDKAIADYNEALRLNPSYPVAYNGRGIAWSDKGEYEKALADYDEALRLLDSKDSPLIATVCCNRGVVWEKTGEYDKAIADYNQALRLLDPKDTNSTSIVYYNRGNIWDRKDEYDKAIADYNRALAINPKFPHAYTNRGCVWRKKGEYGKAIANHNQCLAVDPKHASAYADLAFLRATCPNEKYRDGKKAVENAKKAYELDGGKKWESLDSLAAAYAESGDFEKAKEWQVKAIEMAKADKSATDKKRTETRSRLELYKQGKPYREEPKQKWQREAARAALIEMVKAGKHEELKMAMPNLRSDPIIAGDGDWISIGKWQVNMKDRKFVVDVDAGPIFAEYSGVFTQRENGAWQAEITNETHN